MASYLGDFTTANTVYVYFNTFDSNDPSASATLTGLATSDILIYKNGSTTERSSTAGFTLLDTDGIDFDGKTGIHGFSISLADNTDAGFYAAGGEYTVVVASVTVDAATVNFVAAHFSIERTGGALALLKGTNSLADIESKIDTLTTNVATVDTVVDGIVTTLGTPAGASISADIAVIESQTDDIGIAGAGLTNIGTIATVTNLTNLPSIPAGWITAAGIATGAIDADALAADAGTEIGTAVWATAARTLTAATNITSTGGTTVPQTGDAFARLGAAGAGLTAVPWNSAWTASAATAIWDAATATYGSAGSYGLLVETNINAPISGATAPTAAAVADAVWDEAIAGHLGAGSTGAALNAAGSAGDPWSTALPGAYGAGSAGYILGNNLDAPVSNIDTIVDLIKSDTAAILIDTADMQPKLGTPAGASISADIAAIEAQTDDLGAAGIGLTAIPWNPAWDAEVQSEVADALAVYDPPTKAELDSGLAALNDLTATEVENAVWDASAAAHNTAGTLGNYLNGIFTAIGGWAVGGVALSTASMTAVADTILKRDWTAVTGESARSVLNALRFLRNKWSVVGSTLTITKEDDTTTAWTAAMTSDAAADPITGSDPSG